MIGNVQRGNKIKWNGLTRSLNVEKMGSGDERKRRRVHTFKYDSISGPQTAA